MNVLLLSRYGRLGASSRVRSYQYLDYLKTEGVQVTAEALLDDEYLKGLYANRRPNAARLLSSYVHRIGSLLQSTTYDLVWIEKEIFPWLPAWPEWLLNVLSVRYIVDYDDAIFHRYDQHANPVVRAILGKKIDAVMRRARLVTVGNEYLADRARLAGAARVEYLPTVVDLERYSVKAHQQDGRFTIGWIGSPSTQKYVKLIQPALAKICEKSDVAVTLVGAGQMEIESVNLRVMPWDERCEVSDIQSFDVGIMPLPDEPWERGKCGYKLIQYMASGVPVVASPVGVNQKIIVHGENGFLAQTTDEWLNALQSLYRDPVLRRKLGDAGRKLVEDRYSLQVTAPRLCSLLRSAAGLVSG